MNLFYYTYLCFVFVFTILSCLFLAALCSPDLWALLYVIFSCLFVTFPYGVLGQVWYLIVSIPDICLLPYFKKIPLHSACIQMVHLDIAWFEQ